MALETCAGCSTRYAVGLAACPNCRSVERADGPAVEVPLWADTACPNTACPVVGVQRRVMLPRPTVGVVELPTLLCARCGHVLPLAWPGPDVESDGDPMSPKITRLGGPSNKRDPENAAAAAHDPTPATAADRAEPQGEHGSELVDLPGGMREDPGTGEPMQAVDGDELTGDGSGRALPPVETEESNRPTATDRKDDWVAYAVAAGADPAEAKAMTKADLIKEYG